MSYRESRITYISLFKDTHKISYTYVSRVQSYIIANVVQCILDDEALGVYTIYIRLGVYSIRVYMYFLEAAE